ncbi:hypothetical protein M5K25_018757 [Dendrobium thyrsiflorum]|uniref:Uncharacterized protein n=1 Tax=Dendrobium thyrsiflorum TaxID=117978 RepID=A0ABD0UD43_DENTH
MGSPGGFSRVSTIKRVIKWDLLWYPFFMTFVGGGGSLGGCTRCYAHACLFAKCSPFMWSWSPNLFVFLLGPFGGGFLDTLNTQLAKYGKKNHPQRSRRKSVGSENSSPASARFCFCTEGVLTKLCSERMVEGMMMNPIKIPWFRRPGPSWSLVYLVRGGSRPNLTEGSLSAAMGCFVQGYLVDLGWIFDAIGEHTGSGHDRNLVVSFGGEPPSSESPELFCVGIFYRCLYALTFAIVPLHFLSWVLLKILAALQRRPGVGAASECVRPSRPPIKAVTMTMSLLMSYATHCLGSTTAMIEGTSDYLKGPYGMSQYYSVMKPSHKLPYDQGIPYIGNESLVAFCIKVTFVISLFSKVTSSEEELEDFSYRKEFDRVGSFTLKKWRMKGGARELLWSWAFGLSCSELLETLLGCRRLGNGFLWSCYSGEERDAMGCVIE